MKKNSSSTFVHQQPARKLPRYVSTPLRIALTFSLLVTLLSIIFYPQLQPQIPLFYSLPRSTQQLGHRAWIFLFPTLSFAITLGHFLLINLLIQMKNRLIKLFTWTTVVLQVALFLIFLRLILIIV